MQNLSAGTSGCTFAAGWDLVRQCVTHIEDVKGPTNMQDAPNHLALFLKHFEDCHGFSSFLLSPLSLAMQGCAAMVARGDGKSG
jgi:hypothetical protein